MKNFKKFIIVVFAILMLIVFKQFDFFETEQHFSNDEIILTDIENNQPVIEDQKVESPNTEFLNSEIKQPKEISGLTAMVHEMPKPEKEIVSKRDRVAKHYIREDGKIEAIISAGSVHYKTKTGAWEDINTTLMPSNKVNYAYENTTNNLRSLFPKDLTKHGVIVTSDEGELLMGKNLKMLYTDANGKIIQSHNFKSSRPFSNTNTVNYYNVLNTIDNQYKIETDKIKHNIILNKQPNIPETATYVSFSEEIVLPENWKLTFDQNQAGLVILNKENKVYLRVPPPQVYAKNDPTILAAAQDTGYEIIKLNTVKNTYQVDTYISTAWLLNNTYPIIVDPTFLMDSQFTNRGFVRWEKRNTYIRNSEHCGGNGDTFIKNKMSLFYNVAPEIKKDRIYDFSRPRSCRFDKRFGFGIDFYTSGLRDIDWYRGWITFYTASIDDDANIQSVLFKGDYEHIVPLRVDISSHNYTGSYDVAGSYDLYGNNADASDGTNPILIGFNKVSDVYQAINSGTKHATKTYGGFDVIEPFFPLINDAKGKLQNRLPQDNFQIGLKSRFSTPLIKSAGTFTSSKLKVIYDITRDDIINTINVIVDDITDTVVEIVNEDLCANPIVDQSSLYQSQIIYLDGQGNATIQDPDINPYRLDPTGLTQIPCGYIKSYDYSKDTFTCNDLGTNSPVIATANHSNDETTWPIQILVTVIDYEAPAISLPILDESYPADSGICFASLTFGTTSSDNCAVASTEYFLNTLDPVNDSENPALLTFEAENKIVFPYEFPVGSTKVAVLVKDSAGNAESDFFVINVSDDTPAIDCPTPNASYPADSGKCSASLTFDATVNCSVNSTEYSVDGVAISFPYKFPVGTTTVDVLVTDIYDNTDNCSFDVVVTDDEAPELTCPAPETSYSVDSRLCSASLTFEATSTDNCEVASTVYTVDGTEINFPYAFPVGTTTVNVLVTDIHDNPNNCSFDVVVTDDEAPEITCPTIETSYSADSGECSSSLIFEATSTDNCEVASTVYTVDGTEINFPYAFPVGSTTVDVMVTDIHDNPNNCSFDVVVTDDEAPEITCPTIETSYSADSGECSSSLTFDATSTDNCEVASTVYTVDGTEINFPYAFPVGSTTVNVLVTDLHDNPNNCSFDVVVTDDEAPVIAGCPMNISQGNDAGVCEAIVSWTEPTATDNCTDAIDLVWTKSHEPGVTFAEGTTTVTYTVTDVANNISLTCSFDVTVTNTLPNNTEGIIGGQDPIQVGEGFDLSADFNDDNITYSTWYFSSDGNFTNGDTAEYSQDGTIADGVVSGTFNFDATQTGVYTVKVIVTDACEETAEVTLSNSYVVVYDPSGGFVTGGGWIYSPLGALTGSEAVGKANFGFVSKYKTGKNNVLELDGNTNFQFKEGDFHFKSSVYDEMSLVISGGKKATYRGVGTVNRSGSHKFLVTVIDGDAVGGDGDDKFRIKIWADGSSDDIDYDNEFSAEDNADSSTILGGGSIVIHKPKGNNNAKSVKTKEAPIEEEIFDGFELVSWPNPSDEYFNITLQSKNTVDKINIQVFDLNGRLVSLKTGAPNRDYKIGATLEAGLYFATVTQGNITKIVKLIKH